MGLLLLLLALPIGVVVILRRWRIGRWLAIPAALAAYALIDVAWFTVTVLPAIDGPNADPSMKATLLARGLSLLMNATAVALIAHVPLLIASYAVRLIRRPPPPQS